MRESCASKAGAASGRIAVIDYHKGNLSSVRRGLMRAGWEDVAISDDPDAIRTAAGLVLPGVGAFYDAITFMRASGQDAAILDAQARPSWASAWACSFCSGAATRACRRTRRVPRGWRASAFWAAAARGWTARASRCPTWAGTRST